MSPNEYEAEVLRKIEAWKGEKLSLYSRVTNQITKPVANLFSLVVPRAISTQGVTAAYAASDWLSSPNEVLKLSGINSIAELQNQPLEFCDGLAAKIDTRSQTLAAVDGAVTGAGGFMLAAADVMALTMITLKGIRHTGHCYGFSLDQLEDRPYVLGILMVACTRSPTERIDYLGKLADIEKWMMNETVEAVMIEGLSKQLLQVASVEAVPVIGAAMGSAANLMFCRYVLRSARCIFQERWLRDRGRLPIQEPS